MTKISAGSGGSGGGGGAGGGGGGSKIGVGAGCAIITSGGAAGSGSETVVQAERTAITVSGRTVCFMGSANRPSQIIWPALISYAVNGILKV